MLFLKAIDPAVDSPPRVARWRRKRRAVALPGGFGIPGNGRDVVRTDDPRKAWLHGGASANGVFPPLAKSLPIG